MSQKTSSYHEPLSLDEIKAAINKPNGGLLMVELTHEEAKGVRSFLSAVTMGELTAHPKDATPGLYKIYQALEPRDKTLGG